MNNELKSTLNSLHASLSSNDKVDPELIALLQILDQDIQVLLDKDAHDTTQAADISERALAVAVQFSAQHPNIEATLRQLADILGKMGI